MKSEVSAVPRQGKRPSRAITDLLHAVVIRFLIGLVVSAAVWTGGAYACSCAQSSPDEGFDRAQFVFTGKVAEINGHTWTVDVDRVWKGADKLAKRVRLLDVYTGIDCASYFELGRAYIFFAIVAKSSRYVYYQSEVCNWTRALHSTEVAGPHGAIWLEDLILERHGAGTAPMAEDVWEHRPSTTPTN